MSAVTARLRLEGVRVVRPGQGPGAAPVVVLDGVDLEVQAGEALAVVGPSGAGKTTLLRVMNDLEPVAAGRVLLDGAPVLDLPPHEVRRRVGWVAQVPRSLAATVADELAFGPRLASREPGRADLVRGLEQVGLAAALLDRPMGQLSTGEQQRVAIARALQNRPEVLLLDEPTSALDPGTAGALLAMLAELKATSAGGERGLTLVVVTHGLSQAQALADRVLLLEAGRVVEVAATSRFFSDSAGPRARAFVASGRLSSPSPPPEGAAPRASGRADSRPPPA